MRISDWSSDVCSSDITSRMYLVGDVPIKAKRLVEVTYECLMLGIEQAKPGNSMGDVAHAIQTFAERHRYSVVRDFCGHGVGQMFHRSEEHTSELQSLMRSSYAACCLQKKRRLTSSCQ